MTFETPPPAPSDDAASDPAVDADPAKPAVPRRRLTPLTIPLISVAAVLVVVIVVVLIVVATARPPAADAVVEPEPSASSAIPTDEPIVVPAPMSRIAVPCASLVPGTTLALVTSLPLELVDDGTGTPDGLWSAAERQVGELNCAWGGGSGRTDGGWDDGVTVRVQPEGDAEYRNHAPEWSIDDGYNVFDVVGDDSVYGCFVWGASYQCNGELLTGRTWSSVTVSAASSGVVDEDEAHARFEGVLRSVDASLRSADSPRPRWTAPESVPDPSWFCSSVTTPAILMSAWGLGEFGEWGADGLGATDGVSQCVWSVGADYDSVWVATLHGGAWSLDTIESDQPDVWWLGEFTPVDVAGADRAYVACGDGCLLTMSIEGNRIDVNLPVMHPDAIVAGAPAVAAAIRAH